MRKTIETIGLFSGFLLFSVLCLLPEVRAILFTSHLTNNLHINLGCGALWLYHGIIILQVILNDKLQKRSQDAQTKLKQLKKITPKFNL